MIRELIGRIHIRTSFDGLTTDDLCNIAKAGMVKDEVMNCKLFGIDLEVTDGAVREIANMATKDGTGARGLKGVLDRIVGPIKYEKGGVDGGARVVVDEATVMKDN